MVLKIGKRELRGERENVKIFNNTWLNWLYPRCCPWCHEILQDQTWLVCPKCGKLHLPIGEPRCKKCGKKLANENMEYCRDCKEHTHFYEEGVGIFSYDDSAHRSLLEYKQQGRREYGRYYAKAAVIYGEAYIKRWKPQWILPVPMHPVDKRRRGFQQGADLANRIGRELNIPVQDNLMKKVRRTNAQKKLSAVDRRKNLEKAFEGEAGRWPVDRVLIVDDMYTTGSTIDAMAKEIQAHGVSRVYFLTIFIGRENE